MSFPPYPTYIDSDVEWLWQVPQHWRVGHLRWITQRYSGGTPDRENPDYWQNGIVPWLNSGAVNDRLIMEPSERISESALAHSSAKWIPPGSLVMALAGQGKTKGMVAQLAFRSTCNQSMAAIIPGPVSIRGSFTGGWIRTIRTSGIWLAVTCETDLILNFSEIFRARCLLQLSKPRSSPSSTARLQRSMS